MNTPADTPTRLPCHDATADIEAAKKLAALAPTRGRPWAEVRAALGRSASAETKRRP